MAIQEMLVRKAEIQPLASCVRCILQIILPFLCSKLADYSANAWNTILTSSVIAFHTRSLFLFL